MVERGLVRVQHAKRMFKQTQLHCIISSLIHQLLHFRKCANLEFLMCKLSKIKQQNMSFVRVL